MEFFSELIFISLEGVLIIWEVVNINNLTLTFLSRHRIVITVQIIILKIFEKYQYDQN